MTGGEALPDYSNVTKAYEADAELLVLARLNTILFIDDVGISQNDILPGNIYEIKDNQSPALIKNQEKIAFRKKNNQNQWEDYKDYDCLPIAIELTPPCDFSNKKVMSRIVGGYIVNYSAHEDKKREISGGDKGYVLQPIYIPGDSYVKYIIFDFRHLCSPSEDDLRNPSKYKILFRANHPLFSDVLQKLSSHAAHLGLNGLEVDKNIWK